MDITPAIPNGRKLIEAYGVGRFRISGELYQQAVILCGDTVLPIDVQTLEDITPETLASLPGLSPRPELLLLGTGAAQQFASKALKEAGRAMGIVIESMASDAACRTYNVLLAEARPVAALLLPI